MRFQKRQMLGSYDWGIYIYMSVCPDVNEDEDVVLIIINNCILPSKGPWAIHCDLATVQVGVDLYINY